MFNFNINFKGKKKMIKYYTELLVFLSLLFILFNSLDFFTTFFAVNNLEVKERNIYLNSFSEVFNFRISFAIFKFLSFYLVYFVYKDIKKSKEIFKYKVFTFTFIILIL